MDSLIEAKNISIGYGKKIILRNVSVAAKKGEIIALVGENGSGKSTLLRTLAGLQPSLEGEVFILQKSLNSLSRKEIAQLMSVVLTEKIFLDAISVYDLISTARYPYTNLINTLTNKDKFVIDEAMKLTNCSHLANKVFVELSDGQQQKVMIAKAIAQETPLLFLDEPASFLDLNNKVLLFQLLKQLAQEKQKTILFSTHDVQLALKVANSIWHVKDSIIEALPAEESILTTLIKRETLEFLK